MPSGGIRQDPDRGQKKHKKNRSWTPVRLRLFRYLSSSDSANCSLPSIRHKSRQKRRPAVFLEAPVPTVASIHHLAMVAPPHRWIDTNEAFTGPVLEKFLGGLEGRGNRREA
jgi:hypothetical protein